MAQTYPRTSNLNGFLRDNLPTILASLVVLIGLYLVSRENYLLFHSLVELFSVVISISIFTLVWNTRSFVKNNYLMVLGIALFSVSTLDLLHALAYEGMGVFPSTTPGKPNAANLATQLWLAARYVQSVSMAVAPLFLHERFKRTRPELILSGYGLVTALLFLSIAWGIFPASNLDSVGLTPFKIASEYVIIGLFAIGLFLLFWDPHVRASLNEDVQKLLALSIAFTIASEIAFTGYLAVNDIVNLSGHLLKIIAVFLIYKAIIETGLVRPYSLLFRELAQRESALRESETRERSRALQIEAIMDVTPAIIWIAQDPGARSVTGNRASADLFGLPANANHSRYSPEIAGRYQFYDEEGRLLPTDKLPLHVAAATGQAVRDFQETILSPDGTERHLYGNVAPLLNENGYPLGAVGAFIDITGRVHAEQALQESERRYRTLFETMAEGFALFELLYDERGQAVDYRCYDVNPAFERLTSLSREQLVGKTRREMVPGENTDKTLAAWLPNFERAVKTGRPERIEEYSFLAGKYLEMMINPVRGDFFATLTMDVTERRRSQEALRQSEARMRRLVDSNIIGIIYSRGKGDVTQANDALLQILGYTRAEYEAGLIDWIRITPPEYQPADERAIAEAVERGACMPYEKEYIRKDGSRVPILIGFVYFPSDELAPYVGFILDLTTQKRAEEAVRQYAARLEQSNRELQDFAFVASHDLQEPLRKIQAFGERLNSRTEGKLDEDTRDYLTRMLSSAARMRAMINDLLALSRVTTQAHPFQIVNLNDVSREVLSDLEESIERTGGKVIVGDLPTIEADPIQMHQLLQNLVANALKFHKPDEQPLVKVYAECAQGGRQVTLCIEDNGIGFEEQYAERIFQPFQRLHGMSQYEGSGIGLAICRKIVERHSGTIATRSEPGKGATFIITLPVRQQRNEKQEGKE